MMFGSMYVSVWSSGCVRNLQKNIYSEHTDKKYSPHLEQNISLPFSFPLPVKYCKIIQAGVSKLILSRLHTTDWQSNLIMSMMVVNSANLQHLFKCRKIIYEFFQKYLHIVQWQQVQQAIQQAVQKQCSTFSQHVLNVLLCYTVQCWDCSVALVGSCLYLYVNMRSVDIEEVEGQSWAAPSS